MKKVGRKIYVNWSWFVLALERVGANPAEFGLTPQQPALLYDIMNLGENREFRPVGAPMDSANKTPIADMVSWKEGVWMTAEEARAGGASSPQGSFGRRLQYAVNAKVVVAVEKIMAPPKALGFTEEFDHPAILKNVYMDEEGRLKEVYVGKPVSDISTLEPDEIIRDREAWITPDEAARLARKP
jgi:hypothetical protein